MYKTFYNNKFRDLPLHFMNNIVAKKWLIYFMLIENLMFDIWQRKYDCIFIALWVEHRVKNILIIWNQKISSSSLISVLISSLLSSSKKTLFTPPFFAALSLC